MPNGTGNQRDPNLAPKPNPITSTPATVAACAADYRSPGSEEADTARGEAGAQRGSIQPGRAV